MTEISVLVVCHEASSLEPILGGFSALPANQVERVASLDQAYESLERNEYSIVVVHLFEGIDLEGVEGLAWECSTAPKPVPVVAIGDHYDEKQAITLFRAGVSDYLSLSDHRERVAQIVGKLLARVPGSLSIHPRPFENDGALAVSGSGLDSSV